MRLSPTRHAAISAGCRRATRSVLVGRVFAALVAEHGASLLTARPLQAGAIRQAIVRLADAHGPHTDIGAAARYALARQPATATRYVRRTYLT